VQIVSSAKRVGFLKPSAEEAVYFRNPLKEKHEMKFRYAFRLKALRPLTAICALAILAGGLARADETFAQVFQVNGTQELWTISTTGATTTITASGQEDFLFSGVSGLPFSGVQVATFAFSATSNTAGNCGSTCGNGDTYSQQGYSGTFSYTDNSSGLDLLSGTFATGAIPATSGGQFSSAMGSTGGNFNSSSTTSNLGQLVLSSAYLSFSGLTEDAGFTFSSLQTCSTPVPSAPNYTCVTPNSPFSVGPTTTVGSTTTAYPSAGPFYASASTTFSASQPPPATAPEPATFGLIGGGLLGFGLWRRKKALASAKI
jgi:PEP-CTERM motif